MIYEETHSAMRVVPGGSKKKNKKTTVQRLITQSAYASVCVRSRLCACVRVCPRESVRSAGTCGTFNESLFYGENRTSFCGNTWPTGTAHGQRTRSSRNYRHNDY